MVLYLGSSQPDHNSFINESGDINTHAIKNTHDTDEDRFERLLMLGDINGLEGKLENIGISVQDTTPPTFVIQIGKNETATFQPQTAQDFYEMLRKYAHVFFQKNTKWQNGKIREIEHKYEKINYVSPTDIQLLEAFIETFFDIHEVKDPDDEHHVLTQHESENILRGEQNSIASYTETRKKAINDTLASSEFISERNARNYGKSPFYDQITDNPRLKKKAVLLANMLGENANFIKYANESLSKNSDLFGVFCRILEKIETTSLDDFAALLQIPNFTNYLIGPYNFSDTVCQNLIKLVHGLSLEQSVQLFTNIRNFRNFTELLKSVNISDIMIKHLDAFVDFIFLRNSGDLKVDEIDFLTDTLPGAIGTLGIKNILKNFHRTIETALKLQKVSQSIGADYQRVVDIYYFVVDRVDPKYMHRWMKYTSTLESKIILILENPAEIERILNKGRNPSKPYFGNLGYSSLHQEYE